MVLCPAVRSVPWDRGGERCRGHDRFGRAEEIGAAAAFLSEDATDTTGTVLVCDGGFSL